MVRGDGIKDERKRKENRLEDGFYDMTGVVN